MNTILNRKWKLWEIVALVFLWPLVLLVLLVCFFVVGFSVVMA